MKNASNGCINNSIPEFYLVIINPSIGSNILCLYGLSLFKLLIALHFIIILFNIDASGKLILFELLKIDKISFVLGFTVSSELFSAILTADALLAILSANWIADAIVEFLPDLIFSSNTPFKSLTLKAVFPAILESFNLLIVVIDEFTILRCGKNAAF